MNRKAKVEDFRLLFSLRDGIRYGNLVKFLSDKWVELI
jgi:hypothetical protein